MNPHILEHHIPELPSACPRPGPAGPPPWLAAGSGPRSLYTHLLRMCVCIYIYTYIYLVRHGNRLDVFMVSVVDIIQRFYGFRRWFVDGSRRHMKRYLMVSVVGLLMVSVVAGKHFLWFPSLDCWWILPPQEDPKC